MSRSTRSVWGEPIVSFSSDLSATCATSGCSKARVGKSKYCAEHRDVARQVFLARVKQGADDREERSEQFAAIWKEAMAAGRAAGDAVRPTMMVVRDAISGQVWHESEGACGFAWVVVKPGNCAFVRWVKKHIDSDIRRDYYGGVTVYHVHEYNQSIDRKSAFARAFVTVLRNHGIDAHSRDMLD